MNINEEIKSIGIVPVVIINDAKNAVPLAKALIDGGIPCAEVTFRTEASEEAIRLISEAFPDMLLGAGTVLTIEQVDRAINAGSKFIVSPGFNKKIVEYCKSKGVKVYPGVSSPTNIESAIELGLDTVKFFPAEANGGIKAIKAMSGPYTKINFMPTGGIGEHNLNDYLSFDKIVACGGSWMVKESLIDEGKFDEIKLLTKKALLKMLNLKLGGLRINESNKDEALKSAKKIAILLGLDLEISNESICNESILIGKEFTIDNESGNYNGIVEISTNSVLRAKRYLSNLGFEFEDNSEVLNSKGQLTGVFIKDIISGFKFYLKNN